MIEILRRICTFLRRMTSIMKKSYVFHKIEHPFLEPVQWSEEYCRTPMVLFIPENQLIDHPFRLSDVKHDLELLISIQKDWNEITKNKFVDPKIDNFNELEASGMDPTFFAKMQREFDQNLAPHIVRI